MKTLINDTYLEVVEQGSGDTVLFVHGSNSDLRTWQVQQGEFAKNFHTVTYSRRYHFPNDTIPDGVDYSMTEHLDDLQALVESLPSKPIHLVGHSYGAFLALLLAMREPELIRSLVLTEPPIVTLFIDIPPKPQQILKLLVTDPRTAVNIMQFAVTGLNPATAAAERDDLETAFRKMTSAILGRDTFNALSEERLNQGRTNLIKTEITGSGFLPVEDEDVRQVQIPTLLINGADSPPIFHRLLDRLDELLPHSEHTVIPNASHIVHEDNPTAYNNAVLSFINQH